MSMQYIIVYILYIIIIYNIFKICYADTYRYYLNCKIFTFNQYIYVDIV